ncbi:winged helix-turn-helix domain-containing protein [Umezawaea sp. Da 62-37]|uniref:winged helix-turn-helix domain-containing protein n=1 Tax=Umezawaea sp. Da 62-37 TaxID=3075927 RepID=UPI0028F6E7B8|nr:winged helix-turn-helix domain-containing protein [Umezawaea sp. Da 62-37]WNV86370.1 winged helix-turn-helix domain-containing protein [Umezawaea sp. Da 62-37]
MAATRTPDAVEISLVIRVDTPDATTVADTVVAALRTAFDRAHMTVDFPHPDVEVPLQRGAAELRIFPSSRRVLHRGVPVELTRLEFDLLLHLCRSPLRVQRRAELMTHVWGTTSDLGTRTIDVHVRRIRGKLGRDGAAFIGTVRGVGYRVERVHLVRVEDED